MGNPQKPRLVVECDDSFTKESKEFYIIKAMQEGKNLKEVVIMMLVERYGTCD